MKKHYKSILIIAGICIVFYAIASVNRNVSQRIQALTKNSVQTVELVQKDITDNAGNIKRAHVKFVVI